VCEGKVELHELVRCLDDSRAQLSDVRRRVRRVGKKDKVLDVPLSRHELDKVVSQCSVGTVHCTIHLLAAPSL